MATRAEKQNPKTERSSEPEPEAPTRPPSILVSPITLELAPDLIGPALGDGSLTGAIVPRIKEDLYQDLGVPIPDVELEAGDELPSRSYRIMLDEVPRAAGSAPARKRLVGASVDQLAGMKTKAEPSGVGPDYAWVDVSRRGAVEAAGFLTWDTPGAIGVHLREVLKRTAFEMLGLQEVKNILDSVSQTYPAMVAETMKSISLFQLTDILRRLVEEQISIRHLKTIFYALAEWGQVEHDTVMLTEYVRAALKGYISYKFASDGKTLAVYLLDPQIEKMIRSAIRHTSSGSYLMLDPTDAERILAAINDTVAVSARAEPVVLLTTMELRRYVWAMTKIPGSTVLSYQEVSPTTGIEPIARIALKAEPKPPPKQKPAPPSKQKPSKRPR